MDRKLDGNVLFIDRNLAELEDNAKCARLAKLIELVKKPSNLTKTEKEKPHYLISHFLAYFVEFVKLLYFCFVEGLTGLTDDLAMGGTESKSREFAIGFSE